MSGAEDKESRTEEPTEKRLADAIARGDVPRSPEVPLLSSLLGAAAVAVFLIPEGARKLAGGLSLFVDDMGAARLESPGDAWAVVSLAFAPAVEFLIPVALVLAVTNLAASFAQAPPALVFSRIAPNWSRVSFSSGWARLFSVRGLVQFAKSLLKAAAFGAIAGGALAATKLELLESVFHDVEDIPRQALSAAFSIVVLVAVFQAVLAGFDVVWARIHWLRDQRMSREEVKEEIKQAEGDRLLKARLRSLRMDRSRRRMLAAVPKATLVVANPTHYAVALRYRQGIDAAPVVVARGLDLVALRIRQIAEDNNVPLFEDRPLARSLYDATSLDAAIPPEFYRAIAKLIHLVRDGAKRRSPPLSGEA
jgi:flagellar biosynthetic protein FlhB